MSIESDSMELMNPLMTNNDDDISIQISIHIDSPGVGGTTEKITTDNSLLPGIDATHTSMTLCNPTIDDELPPITNNDSGVIDMTSIDPLDSDDQSSDETKWPISETPNPVRISSTTDSTDMPEPSSVSTSMGSTTSDYELPSIINNDSGDIDMTSIDPFDSDDQSSGGTEWPISATSNPEVMISSTTDSTEMPEPSSDSTSMDSTTSAETTDPTTTPKIMLVFYDPLSANDNTSGFVGDLVMAGAALIRGIKDVPIDLFYVFYDGIGNAMNAISKML